MASLKKYHSTDVQLTFSHNNRQADDGVNRANESIDPERTALNYHLKKGGMVELNKRLDEVFKIGRIDQVIMVEAVVTLPQDVKSEDEEKFFRSVYGYFSNEIGEQNIINAVVHKDEKTPHTHVDFVPVLHHEVKLDNRGRNIFENWKRAHNITGNVCDHLCFNEAIDKEFYQNLHPKLKKYVSDELGYDVSILNGATTNGNKTVLELKAKSLADQIAILERQKQMAQKELEMLGSYVKGGGITMQELQLFPLIQKIIDLENQNKIYRGIIDRNQFVISASEIEKIKEKRYIPSLSVNLNVFDGQLTNATIENNAIVVVELFDQKERPLRQQSYIDTNKDLQDKIRTATRFNRKPVTVRPSSDTDRVYIFIRADDIRQTLMALLEFQQQLNDNRRDWKARENRHVYMERMEFDTFDTARAILEQSGYQSTYFTGRALVEKDGRDMDKGKTE